MLYLRRKASEIGFEQLPHPSLVVSEYGGKNRIHRVSNQIAAGICRLDPSPATAATSAMPPFAAQWLGVRLDGVTSIKSELMAIMLLPKCRL
ncbi:MAG: hypothetical protein DME26_12510 [Verrucomicrobia bacterium]|nr:MAG: hypothetical protein DME26_12510 [Verrucomicrobiota bacterium]